MQHTPTSRPYVKARKKTFVCYIVDVCFTSCVVFYIVKNVFYFVKYVFNLTLLKMYETTLVNIFWILVTGKTPWRSVYCHTDAHTLTDWYTYWLIGTLTYTLTHSYIHTYIHTYTHIHTHTHTRTHTLTQIYIYNIYRLSYKLPVLQIRTIKKR